MASATACASQSYTSTSVELVDSVSVIISTRGPFRTILYIYETAVLGSSHTLKCQHNASMLPSSRIHARVDGIVPGQRLSDARADFVLQN